MEEKVPAPHEHAGLSEPSALMFTMLASPPALPCGASPPALTQGRVRKGRTCQKALSKEKTGWLVNDDVLALLRTPGCLSSQRRSGREVELVGDIQDIRGPPPSNVQTASRPARDGDCSDPQPIRCKGCLQWQACGMTQAERGSFLSSCQCSFPSTLSVYVIRSARACRRQASGKSVERLRALLAQ